MTEVNNAINNTVGASISGVTNTLAVTNPSNTASSQAKCLLTVGGPSAGDAYQQFSVSGTTDWTQGVDNSDADALVISAASTLGTSNTWRMNTGGTRTLPLQPSFTATLTVDQANATGDGTQVAVQYTNVVSNIGSHYDGTSTFTAPATGVYIFAATCDYTGVDTSYVNFYLDLLVNGTTYYRMGGIMSPSKIFSAGGILSVGGSVIVPLTASDTVQVVTEMAGGTKTVSLYGTGINAFSGFFLG